jgi:hypothetical protein
MAYDSPSDTDDESLYDVCLTGDFDDVDDLLQAGTPLDLLDSPMWSYFMKKFLSLRNWRDKIVALSTRTGMRNLKTEFLQFLSTESPGVLQAHFQNLARL